MEKAVTKNRLSRFSKFHYIQILLGNFLIDRKLRITGDRSSFRRNCGLVRASWRNSCCAKRFYPYPILQKKDRELDRESPQPRACLQQAPPRFGPLGQWGPVIFNAWPVRPVFPQKTAIAMANIRYPERRCTLKKIRASAPPRKREQSRETTRRATRRGGRESLQGYSRLCSTGASSPCPFGRLFFSSVRCPSRVYYRLWRVVGRGRNEDLRDGNAKYFCGFIVTHLLYSFVLARLVGFDMESNRRTCFSLVIVDCFSSFKIKLMLVIIKWFFNTCDKTIYFDYFDIKYIRRIEFILNHCILFKMSRIIV